MENDDGNFANGYWLCISELRDKWRNQNCEISSPATWLFSIDF